MAYDIIRYILILIAPGIVGAAIQGIIAKDKRQPKISTGLIYALLTYIVMLWGLYYLKHIYTTTALIESFTCLSFTRRYAVLSTLISAFFGVVGGLLRRFVFRWPFF